MAKLISEWVKTPGVLCDPFCGGGSTLVAAAALGHSVIGADCDADSVALTRKALADASDK